MRAVCQVFTVIISRYTVGPFPMNAWLASFPFRLLMCLGLTLFVSILSAVTSKYLITISRCTSPPSCSWRTTLSPGITTSC